MKPYEQYLVPAGNLAREWELSGEETVMGDGNLGMLEHLIHEVCHAADLDLLPFARDTHKDIGTLCEACDDKGVWYETRTWALEWLVWQELELPFEWGDLAEAADIQGCETPVVYNLLEGNKNDLPQVSKQVLAELNRLCRLT